MDKFSKINDYIYVLYGTSSSNIYYLDCNKKAIIDTGHPLETEKNIKEFKVHGIDITKVDYIINTHSHGDHVGGNAYLKKVNNKVQIIGSDKSAEYQAVRKRIGILKGAEDNFEEYNIDYFINDNEVIDLGDIKLKAILTPGHTIDSISYYIDKFNYLISGDIIYLKVITQLDYYQDLNKSLDELQDSYNKIKNHKIEKFLIGHGIPIDDPQNLDHCFKKIIKLKNRPEIIIINNLIPSAEHYINKNPGITMKSINDYFIDNMMKFKKEPFYKGLEPEKFSFVIEKMINLMLMMNIIKLENDKISLVNNVNEFIGLRKIT